AIQGVSQAAERIYLRHTTIIGFFERNKPPIERIQRMDPSLNSFNSWLIPIVSARNPSALQSSRPGCGTYRTRWSYKAGPWSLYCPERNSGRLNRPERQLKSLPV